MKITLGLCLFCIFIQFGKAQNMKNDSLLFPQLKYRTENCQNNPFDVNSKENIFFYDGGFSCLVNDRKELNSFHEQSKAYVVFELKRIDLVQNGNILKHFEALEISKDSMLYRLNRKNQYVILASQQVLQYLHKGSETIAYQSFQINKPETIYGPLDAFVWDNYEDCLAYAKSNSTDKENVLMVAKVVCIIDRH